MQIIIFSPGLCDEGGLLGLLLCVGLQALLANADLMGSQNVTLGVKND